MAGFHGGGDRIHNLTINPKLAKETQSEIYKFKWNTSTYSILLLFWNHVCRTISGQLVPLQFIVKVFAAMTIQFHAVHASPGAHVISASVSQSRNPHHQSRRFRFSSPASASLDLWAACFATQRLSTLY